jgi:phosphoglycerate dehydrogenase-like enzyme
VTLRFSRDDYERLQELADGMALATYIRAIALNEKMPRRSRRSASSVADKEVQAQILGLLGQSRIANNLNQLAYQANVGTLVIDDETRVQIDEAYENVGIIRETLITALGNGRQ